MANEELVQDAQAADAVAQRPNVQPIQVQVRDEDAIS